MLRLGAQHNIEFYRTSMTWNQPPWLAGQTAYDKPELACVRLARTGWAWPSSQADVLTALLISATKLVGGLYHHGRGCAETRVPTANTASLNEACFMELHPRKGTSNNQALLARLPAGLRAWAAPVACSCTAHTRLCCDCF